METVTITKAEYDHLVGEQARLEKQVEYLLSQMRLARHRQFGASSEKSEYDAEQLNLFNEAEIITAPEFELELIEIEKHYRKRTRLTTDKLPDDLPVEVVEHELPEAERICPDCGNRLHTMGRDTRRELVIIPAQVKIREHIRYVYACRHCDANSDHVSSHYDAEIRVRCAAVQAGTGMAETMSEAKQANNV